VIGDHAEMLACAVTAALDQPVGDHAMLLAPRPLEDALVRNLMQHCVLEDELARSPRRRLCRA
jgi:hypothetical protein